MFTGPMSERRQSFFREDTLPGRRVDAKVKWFNASKGFGFVTPADGSQDAFLPMAVLRRAGYEDVSRRGLDHLRDRRRSKGSAGDQRVEHRRQHGALIAKRSRWSRPRA